MALVDDVWDAEIVPALAEYIRIPNVSEFFDPDWAEHGHMDEAVALLREWMERRPVAGLSVEVVRLPGRAPVIVADVPASGGGPADDTVVLYGHLDKQPEMTGWREGLGPWEPVLEGDRLYGRGGADDGYAAFAALTAIQAVQDAGLPHAHCLVLIEASEESRSADLPAYVDHLADRFGTPSLVVCLDSAAASWDRLWVTTSLRGITVLSLTVEVLTAAAHSGAVGGPVASPFRVLRSLLSRVEDEATGELLLPELRGDVPPDRRRQLDQAAGELGESMRDAWPLVDGVRPVGDTPRDWLEARTWLGSLAVTGLDGLPPATTGGLVVVPSASATLAVRLPPLVDARAAAAAMRDALTCDPSYDARVTVEVHDAEDGWNASALEPWLAEAVERASCSAFGEPARFMGEGGSIPFMSMLGRRFPAAQFVVTGVLGPGSSAHGPNEFLHIPTGKRVTQAVASILADHARRGG